MGTFHHGKGDLHGITVVVDTSGDQVFVGRCDTVTESHVLLLGAEVHDASTQGPKEAFLRRAAMAGHFPRHPRLVVPLDRVTRIERLGDL